MSIRSQDCELDAELDGGIVKVFLLSFPLLRFAVGAAQLAVVC